MGTADRPGGLAADPADPADPAEPADARAMRELLAEARAVSRRIVERVRRVNPDDTSPGPDPPPEGALS